MNGSWNEYDFREIFKDTFNILCKEIEFHIEKRNTNLVGTTREVNIHNATLFSASVNS